MKIIYTAMIALTLLPIALIFNFGVIFALIFSLDATGMLLFVAEAQYDVFVTS